jgi:hypothetical protein
MQQAIDDLQLGRRQVHEQAQLMQAFEARRCLSGAKQADHDIGSNSYRTGFLMTGF